MFEKQEPVWRFVCHSEEGREVGPLLTFETLAIQMTHLEKHHHKPLGDLVSLTFPHPRPHSTVKESLSPLC